MCFSEYSGSWTRRAIHVLICTKSSSLDPFFGNPIAYLRFHADAVEDEDADRTWQKILGKTYDIPKKEIILQEN